MTKTAVKLDDKYTQDSGRIYISSNQALVRLPMMQRQRDVAAGLKTAGYITGYRGSPLGVYDSNLWAASDLLGENHIRFQSGSEDVAVTVDLPPVSSPPTTSTPPCLALPSRFAWRITSNARSTPRFLAYHRAKMPSYFAWS